MVGTVQAEMVDVAVKAEGTVVKRPSKRTRLFKYEMVSDLLGYGRAVFMQFTGDSLKGEGRIEGMFDHKATF